MIYHSTKYERDALQALSKARWHEAQVYATLALAAVRSEQ